MKGYQNFYFTENLAKIFNDMVDCICPKCKSSKVIPVIFGLIECEDDIYFRLEREDLICNPGCCSDSYMNDKGLIPTKYCKDCETYFDYSVGY